MVEANEAERLRKSYETYQKQLASYRKYRKTPKGREAARRYDLSEKKRAASKRYRESEGFAKARGRYRAKEDVVERQREYNRQYFQRHKPRIMLKRKEKEVRSISTTYDESQVLSTLLNLFGTQAKESEIREECETSGVDFNRVNKVYREIADKMKAWINDQGSVG